MHIAMKKHKSLFRWLEPLGLALLLISFGWQCLEEHIRQAKYEGYIYEMNEKIIAIWDGIYDEALHSERYHGSTTIAVNYDVLNKSVKYWEEVQEGMETIAHQESLFFYIRILLYVVGSILIISAKIPKEELR